MASPKEITPPPAEELGHDTEGHAPTWTEPHREILMDDPAELDGREEQNTLRHSPDEGDLLRAQAERLRALLEDEPDQAANLGLRNEDEDEFPALAKSRIEHVKIAQQFIDEISSATLENGKLDDDVIERLRRLRKALWISLILISDLHSIFSLLAKIHPNKPTLMHDKPFCEGCLKPNSFLITS